MKAEMRKSWLRLSEKKNKEEMRGDHERKGRPGNNYFIALVSGANIQKMKKNEINQSD